jgi:hypothetical protein
MKHSLSSRCNILNHNLQNNILDLSSGTVKAGEMQDQVEVGWEQVLGTLS